MLEQINAFIEEYLSVLDRLNFRITDIVEIIVISFIVYQILAWVSQTRAWSLLKGLIFILGFVLLAAIFHMNTILWIVEKCLSIVVIAVVVVLQPELRRALEQLGRKNIFASLITPDAGKQSGRYSDRTIDRPVPCSQ